MQDDLPMYVEGPDQEESDPIKLTGKQELFCQEYLVDFNTARAARAAGYATDEAGTMAKVIGYHNIRQPKILARIAQLRKAAANNTPASYERVLQEYSRIAFFDLRKLYDDQGRLKNIADLDDDAAAVLAAVETEEIFEGYGKDRTSIGYAKRVKVWEKIKALDAIAKMLGYNMPDKMELGSPGGTPLPAPVFNFLPPPNVMPEIAEQEDDPQ